VILVLGLSGCALLLDWLASDRFTLPDDYEDDPASTYGIQFTVDLGSVSSPSQDVLIIYPSSGSNETNFVRTSSFPWTPSAEFFAFSEHVYLTVIYDGAAIWLQMQIDKDGAPLQSWDQGADLPAANQTIEAHLNQ